MRVKSYFAQSVHEAMQKARVELGPEALLLGSKKITQPGATADYEVTFGLSNEAFHQAPLQARQPDQSVSTQLAQLRLQIESMQQSISSRPQPATAGAAQAIEGLVERLVDIGFSPALAAELVQSAKAPVTPEQQPAESQDAPKRSGRPRASSRKKLASSAESLTEADECDALFRHLETRYTVSPEMSSPNQQQRIVVFVGPPGAGKTTTLVKLAMTYGTLRKTPVQILSADTLRLGGAEQLHAYSRILGTGFQSVAGRRALEQALEEYASKKIILIDTPGFAPADMDEAAELADFTKARTDVDVQLVIPATLQASSMYSAVNRFRALCPSKLVFTHLDEMDSPACLLETAIRSALPISFLANGQQIPEDVTEASKTELRALLETRLKQSLAAAA